jgi:hypothetical protein
MRVYLPSTLLTLAEDLKNGEIAPTPARAFAVTPALREAYASGDEEELEYVATIAAARQSLRLLADDPSAPRRRVVLAVDVPEREVSWSPDGDEPASVLIVVPVPVAAVVSGHVDTAEAEADVAAAADAIADADAGDEDAEFTVDGAEGHELAWYAAQELHFGGSGGHPPG